MKKLLRGGVRGSERERPLRFGAGRLEILALHVCVTQRNVGLSGVGAPDGNLQRVDRFPHAPVSEVNAPGKQVRIREVWRKKERAADVGQPVAIVSLVEQ